MYKYPYGDSQQLNLDWILSKLKELEDAAGHQITEDLEVISNALISATFSSSKAYNRSDIVYHDGKLYRANVNIPAPGESWNPAHWDEIMLGDTVANVVRYISSLNNTQVFNSSNVPGTHTSDALNNLKADIAEVSGFHILPFSSGGTVIEDFLNDELALISESGLYFARRAYSSPNDQGYFGTHAVNMLFYSDPTKEHISGIAFSDSAKQFATFRKRESLYEEMHYADEFSNVNTAITNLNGAITSQQGQISEYVETTNKASRSYVKGDRLVYNGSVYVVTTSIAQNATLTVGTNITAETIGSGLTNISNCIFNRNVQGGGQLKVARQAGRAYLFFAYRGSVSGNPCIWLVDQWGAIATLHSGSVATLEYDSTIGTDGGYILTNTTTSYVPMGYICLYDHPTTLVL